ncbi:MAG: hypothetical protein H6922_04285 [Pseudomonadaceae bacterium]|nr:hypothetical protein [Pseudomonadaceae bacterium]
MNYDIFKKNPLTYALGRWVMWAVRFVRILQNRYQRHRIPALTPEMKRRTLLDIAQVYGLETFVETGTYLGETVRFMAPHFKKIVSYELSAKLHKANVKKLAKLKNVELLCGDSGDLIQGTLAKLKSPALFWLDAHYSGGATARGVLDSPIGAELNAVLSHKVRGHVVVIDDSRDFLGLGGYPTIGQLQAFVLQYPDYMLRLKDDLLIVAPARETE